MSAMKNNKSIIIPVNISAKGGAGSGNWGHTGRPGMVGGSGGSGRGIMSLAGRPYNLGMLSGDVTTGGSISPEQSLEMLFNVTQKILAAHDKPYSTASVEGVWPVSYDERGVVKDDIVTQLSQASGESYEDVNKFIGQWARSSNDTDMRSLAIQQDIAKEFGTKLSNWQEGQISRTETELGAEGKPLLPSDSQRNILRAMYEHTQNTFKEAGLRPDDMLTLYRGTGRDSIHATKGAVFYSDVPDVVNYEGNAAESWTAHSNAAYDFGAIVVEAHIPVKNILATAVSGFGCLNEYEYTVLNASAEGSQVFSLGQSIRGMDWD